MGRWIFRGGFALIVVASLWWFTVTVTAADPPQLGTTVVLESPSDDSDDDNADDDGADDDGAVDNAESAGTDIHDPDALNIETPEIAQIPSTPAGPPPVLPGDAGAAGDTDDDWGDDDDDDDFDDDDD